MQSFEDIFKQAKFEVENGEATFEKEFLPVKVGEKAQPVLGVDTLLEHVKRRNYNVDISPNGFAKDIKAEKNGKTITYSQYQNGNVEINFSMELDDIENPESYVTRVMDRIMGELVRREQKTMQGATNYVQNVLPKVAERQNISPQEALTQQLEYMGDNKTEIVQNYLTGDKRTTELGAQYAALFEILPFNDAETNRSEMKGRMPLADILNNPELESRHNNYMTKFLRSTTEETLSKYGRNEELEQKWLEMV